MLNVILVDVTEYFVGAHGPFHDPGRARRPHPRIQRSAEIGNLFGLAGIRSVTSWP